MRFETHSHTHYSNIRLIDSICKPKDLILTAYKLGYSGITLTDHEALCGHVEWLELEEQLKKDKSISEDFKCGLGNEIYLVDKRTPSEKQQYFHYILIAKNSQGHRALRELSSNSWLNSYHYRGMERVPTLKSELEDIVKKYPNSLIATNACIGGELGQLVLELIKDESNLEVKQQINDFILWNKKLFNDDFYIEIAPGISKDQINFNKRVKSIADFYNIKMIVATDAHYLTKDYREIHKSFLNSKNGEREVDSFYYDAHLMDDEEAFNNLKRSDYSYEEFQVMCANSLEIQDKIEGYNIFHNPIIPEVELLNVPPIFEDNSLKDYPNLFNLRKSDNEQERVWINDCLESLKLKGLDNSQYFERLELEADVIFHISNVMGNCLFSYFNTFRHYIDLFWDCDSVVGPGRGSAGSFLSNYLLGITQIDPIEWKLPYFRFLNKDRAELPDIDIDLAPSKRPLILKKIREERGNLNVVQVATFGTTSGKNAILTACRGYRDKDHPKGLDVDFAQFLSSLVPIERGIIWPLKDCLYGNEEKNRNPVRELVTQLNQYDGLIDIVLGIEDLIVRRGQHASGVILYNNSPFDTTALMKSPNGDITTQFDLHRSERLGDTKFDFLVTDICDKISVAIDLLKKDNYFDQSLTKRQIYDKYLHPQIIDLKDNKLWDALAAGKVQDVFQFNTQIGIETAKAIKPQNPAEMTAANALMRLVAPPGQERPLERYLRFKDNIDCWYQEMIEFGLTKEEQKVLEPYYLRDYGVPCSQEQLMLMVMDDNISHFTLAESNNCRKVLAKKKIKEIPIVKEKFLNQCPSKKLGMYAWQTMMEPQMSYSFSEVHSLLYSFIGIQTLILATNFPSIYWDCACLIVNSGGDEEEELEDIFIEKENYFNEMEEFGTDDSDDDIDSSYEEEDCDGYPAEVCQMSSGKKKKKVKTTNYGKIATAIGKIKTAGINVAPPDINNSTFTFSPNVDDNVIRYGLKGITRVSQDLIHEIINNRPYTSLEDFLSKVKVNKPQMINLIKSGMFDCFGGRIQIMRQYIDIIADKKKRVTLQNMKMLIDFNLIPERYSHQCKVYNFNKYLKKMKLDDYYGLDNRALYFYEQHFPVDELEITDTTESGMMIKQTIWDKFYQSNMDIIRPYVKEHNQELLTAINNRLYKEQWDKYCKGSISKWEMDSISCYIHEHELACIDHKEQYWVDFNELPETPEVDRIINIKGRQIPLFKLHQIAGTVLDRDKTKKTVTLLTTTGVVNVKIYGAFEEYDKQISAIGADGKKHVIEKSMFSRGSKIIVTGIRRDSTFLAKVYKNTGRHRVERIVDIDYETNQPIIRKERLTA